MAIVGEPVRPAQRVPEVSLALAIMTVQVAQSLVAASCTHDATFQLTPALGVVDAVVTVAATGLAPSAGGLFHVVAVLIAAEECSSSVCAVDADVSVCATVALNVADKTVAPSSAPGMPIWEYDRWIRFEELK